MLTWSFSLCVQLCVQVPLLLAASFEMSLRSQKSVDLHMSLPSVKGEPSSGACKEARTNLRPSGSWLVAEIVLVKSSWRERGNLNGKTVRSFWSPVKCCGCGQIPRHGHLFTWVCSVGWGLRYWVKSLGFFLENGSLALRTSW